MLVIMLVIMRHDVIMRHVMRQLSSRGRRPCTMASHAWLGGRVGARLRLRLGLGLRGRLGLRRRDRLGLRRRDRLGLRRRGRLGLGRRDRDRDRASRASVEIDAVFRLE